MDPFTKLPDVPLIHGRSDFLVNFCKGKRVLHLGCVDTGMLDARIKSGSLIHMRLADVADELWGFDINEDGVETLRTYGFENLITGDVSFIDQCEELKHRTFDVILASEVVEHLQNPGLFFQAVQHLMTPGHTRLVVTVPNAFRVSTLLWLLQGVEYVHPDHNYWFSYLTITNLLTKNGFQVEEFLVYIFAKHHLVPATLRKMFGGKDGTAVTGSPTPDYEDRPTAQHKPRRGGLGMIFSYVRQFPRRAMLTWLVHKTPFWGDGLIAIAILPEQKQQ